MAEENPIYILAKELQNHEVNADGDLPDPALNTYYALDDGEWVETELGELTGFSTILANEPYAVLMIPHTQITFDENNKITNINYPE
jgi:hypothetical protein